MLDTEVQTLIEKYIKVPVVHTPILITLGNKDYYVIDSLDFDEYSAFDEELSLFGLRLEHVEVDGTPMFIIINEQGRNTHGK